MQVWIKEQRVKLVEREEQPGEEGSPHNQLSLLDAMNAGCGDISPEACQGWIRHSRRFYPRCLAREDIRCDVEENMWPNADDRV